jgi:hypothetical protein
MTWAIPCHPNAAGPHGTHGVEKMSPAPTTRKQQNTGISRYFDLYIYNHLHRFTPEKAQPRLSAKIQVLATRFSEEGTPNSILLSCENGEVFNLVELEFVGLSGKPCHGDPTVMARAVVTVRSW